MIKGINNFQSVDYNALNKINDAHRAGARITTADQQPQQEAALPKESTAKDLDLRLGDIRPRQNASLEDIKLSLNESSAFEMKGKDSDLESLDMEKAISDMQKDQALMQYQYFVGDQSIMGSEDGIVIPK